MPDFTVVERRELNNSFFIYGWNLLSQQRALNWLLRGHMTSKNETVFRQNL